MSVREQGVAVMGKATSRTRERALTEAALEHLLAALDADRERAGAQYQALHGKLVKYFEWERSGAPADHADETINRVARRLAEGEAIEDIGAYAYGVAKLVLRESLKRSGREEEALAQLPEPIQQAKEDEAADTPQQECFDRCLAALTPNNREIIMVYYAGERRAKIDERQQLAERLGSDMNALRVRAYRIRAKLEECVSACVEGRM